MITSEWPKIALGDLVDILSGFAFSSGSFGASGDIPIVRIRDVLPGRSSTFYTGKHDAKYVLQDGDMLIGMDGRFNRARWRGGPALLNQRVCRIASISKDLHEGYLFHFLPSALKYIEDATPFVTVKHLSVKSIRGIAIPLPPMPEQRRISEILDQAETLRGKRQATLAQLDELGQSVFLDMFGELATNPKRLPTARLGDRCMRVTDGTHQPPKWSSKGVPFLFVSNITSGEISFETEKFISDETHANLTRRCPIEVGDVLYSTVGSYGVPALVKDERKFAFQRHIAHIKPDRAALDPEFLRTMLASPLVKRQADKVARGVAQKTVNLADIRDFVVFCPSLELQREFSRRDALVERLRAHIVLRWRSSTSSLHHFNTARFEENCERAPSGWIRPWGQFVLRSGHFART